MPCVTVLICHDVWIQKYKQIILTSTNRRFTAYVTREQVHQASKIQCHPLLRRRDDANIPNGPSVTKYLHSIVIFIQTGDADNISY
jgi:hypothetical protein